MQVASSCIFGLLAPAPLCIISLVCLPSDSAFSPHLACGSPARSHSSRAASCCMVLFLPYLASCWIPPLIGWLTTLSLPVKCSAPFFLLPVGPRFNEFMPPVRLVLRGLVLCLSGFRVLRCSTTPCWSCTAAWVALWLPLARDECVTLVVVLCSYDESVLAGV